MNPSEGMAQAYLQRDTAILGASDPLLELNPHFPKAGVRMQDFIDEDILTPVWLRAHTPKLLEGRITIQTEPSHIDIVRSLFGGLASISI